MPFKVRQNDDGQFEVYNPRTGKVVATKPLRRDAIIRMQQLKAKESDAEADESNKPDKDEEGDEE